MSAPYRIIFAGTPAFAVPSLRALAADPAFSIALVITQPDRPAGRGKRMRQPPVKSAACELGLPLWQPTHPPAAVAGSPLPEAHYLVVVAYGHLLHQRMLDHPRIAPVNVHASLLPRWRGASPVQHAILAGDRETGVTVQRMVRELDAGPILAQRAVALDPRATAEQLLETLAALGASLLVETLKSPLSETPQDPAGVTVCRKLTREDGRVDPATMTAETIDRKVRALVPWPGVRMVLRGREVKVLATELAPSPGAIPVPCAGDSMLYVTRLQSPGGKPQPAAEWTRGHA